MSAELPSKSIVPFEINPQLELGRLNEDFRENGYVRIRNFLRPICAAAIYQRLARDISWHTFVVSNERLMGAPHRDPVTTAVDEEREILNHACDGARRGFASHFDADRIYSEDLSANAMSFTCASTPILDAFGEFMGSASVIDVIRRVAGLEDIGRLHCRAMRLRPGQFETFHSAIPSADRTGKCRACFYLNLTPEWKPEWGGMLEFRTREADVIRAFVPIFNAFDIVSFPQGRWISSVAPFAAGSVLVLSGRIYI